MLIRGMPRCHLQDRERARGDPLRSGEREIELKDLALVSVEHPSPGVLVPMLALDFNDDGNREFERRRASRRTVSPAGHSGRMRHSSTAPHYASRVQVPFLPRPQVNRSIVDVHKYSDQRFQSANPSVVYIPAPQVRGQ